MTALASDDRAQTESLASILMVAIVVTTVGVASVAVLNQNQPESETTADLTAEIIDSDLTVSHRGGDSLPYESTLVIVENETRTWRYTPLQAANVTGDGDPFDPGEQWRLSPVPYGSSDVVTVAVFETASGTRLLADRRVARPPDGGGDGPSTPTTPTTTPPPSNDPPTADFDLNRTTVQTGESIRFSDVSTDTDGTIVDREWEFGDGTTASGDATVTHRYADDGTYTVSLTVTDDDGATATATTEVTVTNRQPTVDLSANQTDVETFEDVEFTADASDPDGPPPTVEWDFDGDGTVDAAGTPVTHEYGDNGTYTAEAIVTDDDGATATATTEVTVANRPPTASFTAYVEDIDGDGYDDVVYDARASTDRDGSLTEYRWEIEGRDPIVTEEPFYNQTSGPFTDVSTGGVDVTLTVVDDDSDTAATTKSDQPYVYVDTPGFELVAALLAVLLAGAARRRGYL
jgi:PKD repeat protein